MWRECEGAINCSVSNLDRSDAAVRLVHLRKRRIDMVKNVERDRVYILASIGRYKAQIHIAFT